MAYNKGRSPGEITRLKVQAKKLVLEQDLTQKQIAKKLGLSEVTMSNWVKKYGWKDGRTEILSASEEVRERLQGFAIYLEHKDAKSYRNVHIHLSEYINLINLQ